MKNRLFRTLSKLTAGAAIAGLTASGLFYSAQPVSAATAAAEADADAGSTYISLGSDDDNTLTAAETVSASNSSNSVASVAAYAMSSMVAITNTSVEEVQNYFGGYGFGDGQTVESVSMGTGIIIGETDDTILIATNAHVIENASDLSVAFVDDSAAGANVVGADATNDLAVISVAKTDISEDTQSKISVIHIGSSANLVVGEQVVAIGNALGYGQSVSSGIVSALNRTISATSSSTYDSGSSDKSQIGLIQTDAAINPGNSGGALLDMNGNLIGINSAKYASTEVEGMGFAIPVDEAMTILEDLVNNASSGTGSTAENPSSSDAYLGVSVATISQNYAAYYGVPEGVYVSSVVTNGAAANAGIRSGDILTGFDGTTIASTDDLTTALSKCNAGDTVSVTFMRAEANSSNYTEQTVQVTLGSRNSGAQQTSAAAR
ncbi:MAG: trypsin-like peptidase domain-containing protein [Lachnospiraceae bacterium]|nr:trypsin-like peptidase domain-containing protein [Lachnospiraceae bacterium]